VERAFDVLDRTVERLETLVESRRKE
jgi:hypothetical protein